ncbi:hypothetical protein [Mesoplasma melaleucae]|uniref:Uncharacterized protein n=1 Tax=Mesoplasma melaleucae TaxID=81459 RepID=A0A2K8NW77_9MOLU|nr:hypothetical protein [Mesoplasma melaleucae]ATZ17806.1 hypothetical protein EMELA_v1c02330 [Mesoplasma melaleucae]
MSKVQIKDKNSTNWASGIIFKNQLSKIHEITKENGEKKELANIEFKTIDKNNEEKRIWISISTKMLTPLKPNFKDENKYFKEVTSLFDKQSFFRINMPETKTINISVLEKSENDTKSFIREEISFFEFDKILKANTQEVKKWVDDHKKDLEQEDSKEIQESLTL